jgi:hypothetical protein
LYFHFSKNNVMASKLVHLIPEGELQRLIKSWLAEDIPSIDVGGEDREREKKKQNKKKKNENSLKTPQVLWWAMRRRWPRCG